MLPLFITALVGDNKLILILSYLILTEYSHVLRIQRNSYETPLLHRLYDFRLSQSHCLSR